MYHLNYFEFTVQQRVQIDPFSTSVSLELAQWKQAVETVLKIIEKFDYERIEKLYFLIFKKLVNYFCFSLKNRTRNIISKS